MMTKTIRSALLVTALCVATSTASAEGKHLFVHSGQSNMARFDETASFAFGKWPTWFESPTQACIFEPS